MNKIVIIGAGPAGLTAAYEILSRSEDYDVTILEASDKVGGLFRTEYFGGNCLDIGSHRLFSRNSRVIGFWENFLPVQGAPSLDDSMLERDKMYLQDGPDPESDYKVMLIRDEDAGIYGNGRFLSCPVCRKNLGMKASLRAYKSFISHNIPKDNCKNLRDALISHFGDCMYEMLIRGYAEKLLGGDPADFPPETADYILSVIPLSNPKDIFFNTFKQIAPTQFLYPKYGAGQLWDVVAKKVVSLGGKIKLGCPVLSLNSKENHIHTVTYLEDGKKRQIMSNICISTLSLRDVVSSVHGEKMDPEIFEAADALKFRNLITAGISLKELSIPLRTASRSIGSVPPYTRIYISDEQIAANQIQIYNNISPYTVENPVDTIWLGMDFYCDSSDELWNKTDEEIEHFAIGNLVDMGFVDSVESIIKTFSLKVANAFPVIAPAPTNKIISFLNRFDNLYTIGRNGLHTPLTTDAAILSAFDLTDKILKGKVLIQTLKNYSEQEKR